MRFLLGLAFGAAGGYAVCRYMESRAHGIPLDMAFKPNNLMQSVMVLQARLQSQGQEAIERARMQSGGGDGTLKPSWMN